MGTDYSFYVKSIATFALTFFGNIISVLASVYVIQYQDDVILQFILLHCQSEQKSQTGYQTFSPVCSECSMLLPPVVWGLFQVTFKSVLPHKKKMEKEAVQGG